MSPLAMCLLVGACCALCAAIPSLLWSRAVAENDRMRIELAQARRTIQSLHKQMGLTETQYIPLSVSQRWMKGE